MTKDDITKWARESGGLPDPMVFYAGYERFAALVAAHKAAVITAEAYRCGYEDGMEAAAVVCENLPMQRDIDVYDQCATAIRARKEST